MTYESAGAAAVAASGGFDRDENVDRRCCLHLAPSWTRGETGRGAKTVLINTRAHGSSGSAQSLFEAPTCFCATYLEHPLSFVPFVQRRNNKGAKMRTHPHRKSILIVRRGEAHGTRTKSRCGPLVLPRGGYTAMQNTFYN